MSLRLAITLSALASAMLPATVLQAEDFQVSPGGVALEGNFARVQLVVTAADAKGGVSERSTDQTPAATYQSARPEIASVSKTGQVLAVSNGETAISVTVAGTTKSVPVKVSGVSDAPTISFSEHVLPILSKAGCNAGACHAAQYGKGGFKLSVFASEPGNDHLAIVPRRDGPADRAGRSGPQPAPAQADDAGAARRRAAAGGRLGRLSHPGAVDRRRRAWTIRGGPVHHRL